MRKIDKFKKNNFGDFTKSSVVTKNKMVVVLNNNLLTNYEKGFQLIFF